MNTKKTLGTSRRLLFAAIFTMAGPVMAQQTTAALPPLDYQLDVNGVDYVKGTFNYSRGADVSIGPAGQGLSYSIMSTYGHVDNWFMSISSFDHVGTQVSLGDISDYLLDNVSTHGTGATLSNTLPLVYTSKDGVKYEFTGPQDDFYWKVNISRVSKITYPNGLEIRFYYSSALPCNSASAQGNPPNFQCRPISRLKAVTNNLGYMLHIDYQGDVLPEYWDIDWDGMYKWQAVSRVTAINLAVEYCDPNADHCTLSNAWPFATYSVVGAAGDANCITSVLCTRTITDSAGLTTVYRFGAQKLLSGVKNPDDSTEDVVIDYETTAPYWVHSVTNERGTTTYHFGLGSTETTTATDALGHVTTAHWASVDSVSSKVDTITDALGRVTRLSYNSGLRLERVTHPEGNYTQYTYDARGNVTEIRNVAKPSSGLSDIVTTFSYDATCSNPKTCNQPNYTIDPRGNRIDFTYNPTSGLLETTTSPAPTAGAVRPKVTNTITAKNARYLTGPSTYTDSSAVYLATGISSCANNASCLGTADESRTTITYGTPGQPNNLLPTTVTTSAGDGSNSSSIVNTYNNVGDLLTQDGPLAGTADKTRIRYDSGRRVTGTVGPDADGSGTARKPVAVRNTYDTRGFMTLTETGTVNSIADADWANFVVAQSASTDFDTFGRVIKRSAIAAGSTYAVAQTSYDTVGRVDCEAVRMNPSTYGSLPAACTATAVGTNGPDQIVKTTYTNADQVFQVIDGYGGASPRTRAITYTNNGNQLTLTDGRGNLTTYEYDGQDRLKKTRYPDATAAGTSSTTDYEQVLSFDQNSNATSVRMRNGNTIGFTFDTLNRVTFKDLPENSADDIYYAYDNFNRLLSARFGSQSGLGIISTYDAVGMSRTTTSFGRTVSRAYDLSLNRTRLTYPGSFFVDYNYDFAGEPASIVDSTSTTLAAFSYDVLGRRNGFGRGNAPAPASTGYAYDGVGRLQVLSHDLAGTSYDGTSNFTYAPSSQLATRGQTNDAIYTWSPTASSSVAGTFNGLNQANTIGSVTTPHDSNGNVSGVTGWTYVFNSENRLISAIGTNSTTLKYDPLGMLNRVTPTTGTDTQFLYDGPNLIAEFDASSGALLRRYVHGPSTDEPIAWYEGTGTSNRSYLFADERGSIVAVGDSNGAGTANYQYSPDGVASATTGVRFKYTGQIVIPEIGLYYYKARFYSPGLSRFLQPDPAGYLDGMNLYSYVGGDQVNLTDPQGLSGRTVPFCGSYCEGGDFWIYDPYQEHIEEMLEQARRETNQPQSKPLEGGCHKSNPNQGTSYWSRVQADVRTTDDTLSGGASWLVERGTKIAGAGAVASQFWGTKEMTLLRTWISGAAPVATRWGTVSGVARVAGAASTSLTSGIAIWASWNAGEYAGAMINEIPIPFTGGKTLRNVTADFITFYQSFGGPYYPTPQELTCGW